MKILTILFLFLCYLISPRETVSQSDVNINPSSEEKALMKELSSAKISGDRFKMVEIQSRLDNVTGSETKAGHHYPGIFVLVNEQTPPFITDVNVVGLSALTGIRALATATEQRGVNVGRLWVVAAVSCTTERDTIYYFRSDDGGTSWVQYGYFVLGNSDEVNYDQMDVERIEDNTGDQDIGTIYGLTASNGKKFIGANVLRTPTFLLGAFALGWPGENFSNATFGSTRPRICSDNSRYGNTASVYIVISSDSLWQSGAHFGRHRFAKCINPYTTSPSITYIPPGVLIAFTSSTTSDLHGDIAYIHNTDDSIMVVTSNHYQSPDKVGVRTYSTIFNGNNSTAIDNGNTFNKEFARIAISGGFNQITAMIVYRENYQNSGDWDIKANRTTNGGESWGNLNVDIRRDNIVIPFAPDICAVRNRNGRFCIAYTVSGIASYDTVKYVFTDSQNPGLFYRTVNHLSGFNRPKPGIRLVNNDSCFSVWSEKSTNNGSGIWASGGCSAGFTIGIQNISGEIPVKYYLEQNYPNPFNPATNIHFAIPRSGYVNITVYDISGREITVLVNEQLSAGSYNVDFDGSNFASGVYFYRVSSGEFTAVKKMILIK